MKYFDEVWVCVFLCKVKKLKYKCLKNILMLYKINVIMCLYNWLYVFLYIKKNDYVLKFYFIVY